MKYNNIIFLGLCLGLTTYSALSADSVIKNAQFPLKARAITVNGNASQGTIEALINVIYTWQ